MLTGAAVLPSACAREAEEPPLPAACSAGRDPVLGALEAAPRPVRLDGTPLSACVRPSGTSGGDLQTAGASLVSAASALADAAARRPEGPDALRLGYLVGAAQRGAGGPGAPGTSTEMVRRIELELDAVPARSRAVEQGLRAGRRTG